MPKHHFLDEAHDVNDRIRGALARNPYFSSRTVNFEIHDQSVVLRGRVRSFYHKQIAQESLRSIDGIRQIHNELQVVS